MTKARAPGSLKLALFELVKRAGGNKVAGGVWGCKPQNVARMTDDKAQGTAKAQNPPRIDQVAQLEAIVGEPVVTTWLAAQLNCIVEPVACPHHEPLPLVMGRITKETGEMLSAAALAVGSGRLTPTNAANILRETDDVVCALVELRAACRDVLRKDAA